MDERPFLHKCIEDDCEVIVQYDDEPWCFKHSLDSGSSLVGYSARAYAMALPANVVISMLGTAVERLSNNSQLSLPGHVDIRVTALLNLAKEWVEHNPPAPTSSQSNA